MSNKKVLVLRAACGAIVPSRLSRTEPRHDLHRTYILIGVSRPREPLTRPDCSRVHVDARLASSAPHILARSSSPSRSGPSVWSTKKLSGGATKR